MKKIKRGDEDVRPAGGKQLYLVCGNLEMFNWLSHCPQFLTGTVSRFSPISFTGVGNNTELSIELYV